MSNADERGALGKRFHDLPTTPDSPDLAWEAMARHVLPPNSPEKEPEKHRLFFWWWFVGAMLLLAIGILVWPTEQDTFEDGANETIVIAQSAKEINGREVGVPASASGQALNLQPNRPDVITTRKGQPQPRSEQVRITQTMKNKPLLSNTVKQRTNFEQVSVEEKLLMTDAVPQNTATKAEKGSLQIERQPKAAIIFLLPLPSIASIIVPEPVFNLAVLPVQEEQDDKPAASLSLMAGGLGFQSEYTGSAAWLKDESNELSPELALRYTQPFGEKLFVSTGIELRKYRFRTAFENTDPNARIYQPGTVDTIFRNLATGEDRIVTTDTVGGTRTLRFGNDNTVLELGIPLMIGRQWTLGKHGFSLAVGPRVGLVLSRTGRTVVGPNLITDVETAPQFSRNLNLAGRVEFGYGFRLSPVISLTGNIGAESALTDWAETVEIKQYPTVLSGRLGLRFTLK